MTGCWTSIGYLKGREFENNAVFGGLNKMWMRDSASVGTSVTWHRQYVTLQRTAIDRYVRYKIAFFRNKVESGEERLVEVGETVSFTKGVYIYISPSHPADGRPELLPFSGTLRLLKCGASFPSCFKLCSDPNYHFPFFCFQHTVIVARIRPLPLTLPGVHQSQAIHFHPFSFP